MPPTVNDASDWTTSRRETKKSPLASARPARASAKNDARPRLGPPPSACPLAAQVAVREHELALSIANPTENANEQRRGWDSNPRRTCALSGFQDRRIRPLCHPSEAMIMRGVGASSLGR